VDGYRDGAFEALETTNECPSMITVENSTRDIEAIAMSLQGFPAAEIMGSRNVKAVNTTTDFAHLI